MDTDLVGKVVGGKYRLVRFIDGGGMARVYEARHLRLGKRYAIKILRDEYVSDQRFVLRFDAEARAAADLDHPNLVPVHDVGQDGRLHYIVMEYVEGRTLAQHIAEFGSAPMPLPVAVRIAAEIAATLEFVHKKGFIHRDVKPQNVMITPHGAVKMMDLGIAKGATSTSLTEKSVVLGSAAYSSPEQLRGEKVTAQSDIYSLGVTLFEMLTGRLPIESHTQEGWWYQHTHTPPPQPSQYNPAVAPWLDAIVLRALAKTPEARFSSAAKMQLALASGELNAQRSGEWTAPLPLGDVPTGQPGEAQPGVDPGAARQANNRVIYIPAPGEQLPFVLRIGPWNIVLSGPFWWALRAWLAGPVWLRLRRFALVAGTFSLLILLVLGVVGIIQGGVLPLSGGPGSPATASPTGQLAAASTATSADGGTDGPRGQAAPPLTPIPTSQPVDTPIRIPTTDLAGSAAAHDATSTALAAAAFEVSVAVATAEANARAETATAAAAATGTALAGHVETRTAMWTALAATATAQQQAAEAGIAATSTALAVAVDTANKQATANAAAATAVAAARATGQADEEATRAAVDSTRTAAADLTRRAAWTATAEALAAANAALTRSSAETATAAAIETRQASDRANVAATNTAIALATAEQLGRDRLAAGADFATHTAIAAATATEVSRAASAQAAAQTATAQAAAAATLTGEALLDFGRQAHERFGGPPAEHWQPCPGEPNRCWTFNTAPVAYEVRVAHTCLRPDRSIDGWRKNGGHPGAPDEVRDGMSIWYALEGATIRCSEPCATLDSGQLSRLRDRHTLAAGAIRIVEQLTGGKQNNYSAGDTIPAGVLIATDLRTADLDQFPVNPQNNQGGYGLFGTTASFKAPNAGTYWCLAPLIDFSGEPRFCAGFDSSEVDQLRQAAGPDAAIDLAELLSQHRQNNYKAGATIPAGVIIATDLLSPDVGQYGVTPVNTSGGYGLFITTRAFPAPNDGTYWCLY